MCTSGIAASAEVSFLWVVVNHQGGFEMLRILLTIVLFTLSMTVYAIGGPGTRGGAGFIPPPGFSPPGGGTAGTPGGGLTPPPGVTPPPCVQTGTCTPADFVGLLPPGFTPPPGVPVGPPGDPAAP